LEINRRAEGETTNFNQSCDGTPGKFFDDFPMKKTSVEFADVQVPSLITRGYNTGWWFGT